MRVVSSLADIDFSVGKISRKGADLIIESSEDSTLPTKVTVTPRDAAKSVAKLLTSGSVWLFLLRLPFAAFGGSNTAGKADGWEERRRRTGLNKPW